MDKKLKKYVNDVLRHVNLNANMRRRLKEDLLTTISEKCTYYSADDIIRDMGDPRELANEFMKEYEVSVPRYLSYEYEYVSKIKWFGIPLVHITYSKINIRRNIAKGIIAIGPMAIGVLPIGALSIGVFSIGAISLGLISLASISIGLLFAVGSISIGLGSIGAVAIGYIARGAVAVGHTAIGIEAYGNNTLVGEHLSNKEVYEFIKSNHPNLVQWVISLFSFYKE